MNDNQHKTVILGAGPAGLASGYFLRKENMPFHVYEATNRTGGNCATLQKDGFRFDTGAHRFHDKNTLATELVKELVGDELKKINAPSKIYFQGNEIDFPLSPLNIVSKIGFSNSVKAALDFVQARFASAEERSFEDNAISAYGSWIANHFLLNYSEKLWGVPCSGLSPVVSGNRLKGLDFATFVKELRGGTKVKTEHLDGSFYYPESGYGTITEKLAAACGMENISLESRITKVFHRDHKIHAVEVNGEKQVSLETLVSSIPITALIRAMDPVAPPEVLKLAGELRFRNVALVVILLDKGSVGYNATTYFPEVQFPFTRVYEPKIRGRLMAPEGKTSLVAEIPYWPNDQKAPEMDSAWRKQVINQLVRIGWIRETEIRQVFVHHISNAYSVIETGTEDKLQRIMEYLGHFENLHLAGRTGLFAYTHLHDMIAQGREISKKLT